VPNPDGEVPMFAITEHQKEILSQKDVKDTNQNVESLHEINMR
jgi:hypothetical protein